MKPECQASTVMASSWSASSAIASQCQPSLAISPTVINHDLPLWRVSVKPHQWGAPPALSARAHI
eukprot:1247561-Karenia_brevis.AAC.1